MPRPRPDPPNRSASFTVPFASALVGLIVFWALAKAVAPDVEGWVLLARYLVYSSMFAVLYHIVDASRPVFGPPLAAFSGLPAAACAAGPYVQICGVSGTALLFYGACFWFGWAVVACWGRSDANLEGEVARQVALLAKAYLVASTAILGGAFAMVVAGSPAP